jgi:DNA polymerase family A
MLGTLPYRAVILLDFEFIAEPGERPVPVCMVAHEPYSGQRWRLWADQLGSAPPFPTGPDVLVVAYYASAELGCYRVLGWPMPERILDLFTEFRDRTNGLETPSGSGLLGALTYFGLDSIGAEEKEGMRALVLSGGPWSAQEREAILDYCEGDVMALKRLLGAMLPGVDLPRALVRGRYMAAAAAMEHNGIPIDQQTLALLREHWEDIQDDLIASVDMDYGVYDGRTFKADRWEQFLVRHNIPWPRTEKGALSLADDTFRQMAKAYPEVSPIRELRSALSELRLADLAVGSDGRNRTILSAFRSRTSRNQPSSSKYIFGNAVWLRGLIKPQLGYGIAYIDYSQQEFGIAAALSGDPAMQAAYLSGDPYLAFAKQAGAVPPDATKETHGPTRELFKTCALGVLYGMAEAALATRIGQPVIVARDLLRAHREAYRRFWGWSDAVVDFAMLTGALHTSLGWHIRVGGNVNPRSLRNFPMQANGAEILRLACCLATESGIEVCGPVHDALLICAPLEELEAETASIQAIMTEAGRVVLKGFELRTDATSVRYPNRYMDKRGEVFWGKVMSIVARRQQMQAVA